VVGVGFPVSWHRAHVVWISLSIVPWHEVHAVVLDVCRFTGAGWPGGNVPPPPLPPEWQPVVRQSVVGANGAVVRP